MVGRNHLPKIKTQIEDCPEKPHKVQEHAEKMQTRHRSGDRVDLPAATGGALVFARKAPVTAGIKPKIGAVDRKSP